MADSDDEYQGKRRDKFRGERSAGDSYRSERRDERRREDWPERNPFRGRARPDYRDYRAPRDRYSPGRELPPPKRMRPDWGHDSGYGIYGWGHEHYPMHAGHAFGGLPPVPAHPRENPNNADLQTQPPMLTLKQFLDTQDDGISDSEVLRKYSEYKLDFKRQQLNEFFVAHKDEEWFKSKYHPEESLKRKEEQFTYLNNRVNVFSDLLESDMITSVSVDTNQTEPLLRLLDTVVIKLEGGTEEDLKILDEKPQEYKPFESKLSETKKDEKDQDDDVIITDVKESDSKTGEANDNKDPSTNNEKKDDPEDLSWISNIAGKNTKFKKDEDDWDTDGDEGMVPDEIKQKTPERKRSDSESSDSSIKSDVEKEKPVDKETGAESPNHSTAMEVHEENAAEESRVTEDAPTKEENVEAPSPKNSGDTEVKSSNEEEEGKTDNKSDEIDANKTETIDLDKEKDPEIPEEKTGPRALHRTSSIFLRNLAPTITKAEIEAICKKYNGYLRVAIADPLVERRWFRRGWVTFKRDVNIKEICWSLNNIRLRDCELGAIVNRDLSRRVRPVNGITAHKSIVRSDIKLCARIAHNLDQKSGLWSDFLEKIESNGAESQLKELQSETFGFKTTNPVLQNITDYLIEEGSAEEDELLGLSGSDNRDSSDGEHLDRDPQLVIVLDKLILYLRIVHSVDFYNHCEYPYEDEMPNLCGIIHARGPPPQNKISNTDIQDYIKNFETKMSSFLTKSAPIEEDELKNLGCKNPEAEVEKFIQANTQELAKDKWLCPLSGKKFKGPEFIRKHIFNKHNEKVDEVRKEVEYFNNYLKDSKRPQLPEHPGNVKRSPAEAAPQMPYRGYPAYAPPYAAYAPPMIAPQRPRGFGNRRGQSGDYRPIIHYRDLDAPREPVDFL